MFLRQISTGENYGHRNTCRQRQVVSRRKPDQCWLAPASQGHRHPTRIDPRCHRRTLVSTADQTGTRSEVDQHRLAAATGCLPRGHAASCRLTPATPEEMDAHPGVGTLRIRAHERPPRLWRGGLLFYLL